MGRDTGGVDCRKCLVDYWNFKGYAIQENPFAFQNNGVPVIKYSGLTKPMAAVDLTRVRAAKSQSCGWFGA